MNMRLVVGALAILGLAFNSWGDPAKITVNADQPGAKISPMLYGLMTEEINHSYDGGLYAELIQNRIFQDGDGRGIPHWSARLTGAADAKIELDAGDPINTVALTKCLKLTVINADDKNPAGIANDGFWGIPVKPNTSYTASFYVKYGSDFSGPLTVAIESDDGKTTYASALDDSIDKNKWRHKVVMLKTGDVAPTTVARFVIKTASRGSVYFNLVSLFPPTFKNRPNGNRVDLMEKLRDMHPSFLRFPGGNYLEGNTIEERFNWKETIGPLENRPGHEGPWGYRSSDGFGLQEFLDWCEDIHMEPVLAVFAGYSLQQRRVLGDPLTPHVQDALDEIEYVTGDKSTKWGGERAKNGHPEPYKLTYVEIGNEDNFDNVRNSYNQRFAAFYDAIKGKYPQLKLIATTPVTSRRADVVDDHYYRSAREMERDVNHYDNIDRNGPKIFVGEWASTEGSPTPTLNAALGDAAWMMGMERNSDLIVMQCYAPLLVNVNPNARQWGTNLIGYDGLKSFGSPSYYAQRMFAENRGDTVLPVKLTAPPPSTMPQAAPHGGIGLGTWATSSEYKDLKVTKADGTVLYQSDFSKGMEGWKSVNGDWKASDGSMAQTSNNTDCRLTGGDAGWTDYTYTLKARKVSGNEGFLILFHVQDDDNYLWWNIGGWTNSRSAIQKAENGGAMAELRGSSVNMRVENNRWYDVRIEVTGRTIKCYLDDKLITTATDAPALPGPTMFAAASREDATGDVILKIVNQQGIAQGVDVEIDGGRAPMAQAAGWVLSGQAGDVNSVAEPEKVAPKRIEIGDAGPKFTYAAPAASVTVLRLKTR